MCACTDIFAMDIKESGDGVPSLWRMHVRLGIAHRAIPTLVLYIISMKYTIFFLEFTANRTFSGENFP